MILLVHLFGHLYRNYGRCRMKLFRDVSYPAPMVDIQEANRKARDTLWSVKKTDRAKEIANRQLQKHGSRKFSKKKRSKVTPTSEQLSFDLFDETES